MIKIIAENQPIKNAKLEHVYSGDKQILFCITANEGYALTRIDCESENVRMVYIPAQSEERIKLYEAIEINKDTIDKEE